MICQNHSYLAHGLRTLLIERKKRYLLPNGETSIRWAEEGVAKTILEYCACVGSVRNFSSEDFAAALEEDWTHGLVEDLCAWQGKEDESEKV